MQFLHNIITYDELYKMMYNDNTDLFSLTEQRF